MGGLGPGSASLVAFERFGEIAHTGTGITSFLELSVFDEFLHRGATSIAGDPEFSKEEYSDAGSREEPHYLEEDQTNRPMEKRPQNREIREPGRESIHQLARMNLKHTISSHHEPNWYIATLVWSAFSNITVRTK